MNCIKIPPLPYTYNGLYKTYLKQCSFQTTFSLGSQTAQVMTLDQRSASLSLGSNFGCTVQCPQKQPGNSPTMTVIVYEAVNCFAVGEANSSRIHKSILWAVFFSIFSFFKGIFPFFPLF